MVVESLRQAERDVIGANGRYKKLANFINNMDGQEMEFESNQALSILGAMMLVRDTPGESELTVSVTNALIEYDQARRMS